jgi:hypothetical protein
MITFDSEMQKLSPERRVKIEVKTQELLNQLNMIRQIIEKLNSSQLDLSEILSIDP